MALHTHRHIYIYIFIFIDTHNISIYTYIHTHVYCISIMYVIYIYTHVTMCCGLVSRVLGSGQQGSKGFPHSRVYVSRSREGRLDGFLAAFCSSPKGPST